MSELKTPETAWYYVREKKKVGPVSLAHLQELAARGELGPSDMVLQQGSAKWAPASSIDNLFPPPAAGPVLPPPASAPLAILAPTLADGVSSSLPIAMPLHALPSRNHPVALRLPQRRLALALSGAGLLLAFLLIAVTCIAVIVGGRNKQRERASVQISELVPNTGKKAGDSGAKEPLNAKATSRGDSALHANTLAEIKAATVFIRVEKDKVAAASGSGFVIHVAGETAWIATNHHVVNLTTLVKRRVGYIAPRQPPRFIPGVPPPIRPFGPDIRYRTEIVEVAVPAPNLTMVFGSGTKNERSVKAEVVATDAEADLAVVKVTGLKDAPKPVSLKSPELIETMPVFMFGFPLGKLLSLDKGNPAITVGRGSVSSIRMIKGEVGVVQLDGDINPGNSGGPVVDEKGQLVGVVVAFIRSTRIGLAIPTHELQRVLAGRTQQPKLVLTKPDKGEVEVEVEVGLLDPLEKIRSIALHYAPTDSVTDRAKQNGLAKLADAKKVDLKRDQQKARGTFSLPVTEKGELDDITCQVSYVNGDGKTVLGDLKPGALKAPAKVVGKPTKPAPETRPPSTSPPKPPPVAQVEEKFDGAGLAAALKPSKPGDRGVVVGVTLQPLLRKALPADDLTQIIADLQTPKHAKAAIGELHNTQADPKRQAQVARLIEKWAAKSDWDSFARASACTALRWWGTPESIPVLATLSKDNIFVRHAAMWSMAYLGGDQAAEAIAGRIEDFIHRGAVVQMLQQMGSVSEPHALKLLGHPAPEIRVEAAKILQTVGTKDSAGPLLKVAEQDANANVRKFARDALRTIAGRQEKK